jgi:lipopolysaccharide heptosyltransferase II
MGNGSGFVNLFLNWYNHAMPGYANYSRKARLLARLLDLSTLPLSMLKRKISGREIKKILLVRPDHLGDLMMALDAMFSLKNQYPESQLHLITPEWNQPLCQRLPFIDKTHYVNLKWYCFNREKHLSFLKLLALSLRLRKEKYDLFIDFRGDFRIILLLGWIPGCKIRRGFKNLGGRFLLNHTCAFNRRDHFGLQNFNLIQPFSSRRDHFKLPLTRSEESRARKICHQHKLAPASFVIIHPAVARYWRVKKWKDTHFIEIGRHILSRHQLKIVLCTGPREQETGNRIARSLPETINLSGQLTLMEFAALMARSLVLLSNDSAPMHLAVNLGVPLLAVFGPTDYRRSGPYPFEKKWIAVEGDPGLKRPLFGVRSIDDRYFPAPKKVIEELDGLIEYLNKPK